MANLAARVQRRLEEARRWIPATSSLLLDCNGREICAKSKDGAASIPTTMVPVSAKQFGQVLREGPDSGVHTLALAR